MGKLSAIVTAGHAAFRVEGGEATTANVEGEVRSAAERSLADDPARLDFDAEQGRSRTRRPSRASPARH